MQGANMQMSNRTILVSFVAAAALIVGFMGVLKWHHSATAHDQPVAVPATLAGLGPATGPPGSPPIANWGDVAQRQAPGAAVAVAAYGPGRTGQGPRLNLTVVRGDLTGKFDERLGAAPYRHVGDVTCTQMMDFGLVVSHVSNPVLDPHKVLCWRNSADLSVLVFALVAPDDYVKTTADAVDQAWDFAH
jgi:hypothetical protein